MKSFNYVITDEIGIHARPAGLLVKEAKNFECAITLHHEGKSADARKLMGVMALGIKNGAAVTVECEGADEDLAVNAMEAFFKNNL